MFVACEVGFWDDPLTLAFVAKVRNPDAAGWILRLREFILTKGKSDGRLPGYSAEAIAAKVHATCPTRTLISALSASNFLKRRKRTFYDPHWKDSPTGKYCKRRDMDALNHEELRKKRHEDVLGSIGGGVVDESQIRRLRDVSETSERLLKERKKGRRADVCTGPPGAPRRGVSEGAARWEWFERIHLKIQAPGKCQRLLAELSKQEWEHLQYALPRQMAPYSVGKCIRWCKGAFPYLAEKRFLEIRLPTPEQKRAAEETKKKVPERVFTKEEEKEQEWKFLRECLPDSIFPEKAKEARKKIFFERWGEKPWENPPVPSHKK